MHARGSMWVYGFENRLERPTSPIHCHVWIWAMSVPFLTWSGKIMGLRVPKPLAACLRIPTLGHALSCIALRKSNGCFVMIFMRLLFLTLK